MSHKLRSITIAGYKSIRHAEVELRDINILIGANGAGKSNFVGAFGLLHDMVQEHLAVHVARRGGANSLLHLGQKVTAQMSFKLDFHPNGYEVILAPAINDSLYFHREMCWSHREPRPTPHTKELGAGHTESKLRSESGISQHVIESIESWRVFHFHDTSESAPVKQKHEIDDNMSLRSDAANLAAFLYRLRESGVNPSAPLAANGARHYLASYRQIVGAVRLVAPFFDDFILLPDRFNQRKIQLAWRQKGSEEYFGAHSLSDGTLRFICLATLLLQPPEARPKAIVIDEPELGLHPFAIHQLAAMIRSAATHTQVIISTQSVTLMNQFQPEHVVVVDRDASGSTFRRISSDEVARWADEYALGEIWEKNIIGGRPQ